MGGMQDATETKAFSKYKVERGPSQKECKAKELLL